MMQKFNTINEYIAAQNIEVQAILQKIRAIVVANAPDAIEKISYGMPSFYLNGQLVYFAAFKNHIGLYALPSGNAAFQKELSNYKTGKGSIQFQLNEPIPYDLIAQIVKFRVDENKAKELSKKNK